MTDEHAPAADDDLQFDKVTTKTPSSVPGPLAVSCAGCQSSIQTEYYDVNGNTMCGPCRTAIESAAETPRGVVALAIASAFGLGAGIVGAVIYCALLVIAHLEIGIVAILIGYMVGYAVRRGAGGGGGRRFQVLAVALTYFSVALGYAPLAVKGTIDAQRRAQASAAAAAASGPATHATTDHGPAARPSPSVVRILVSLALLAGLVALLPVLVVAGSFPSGLISAFIIFIGMRQAWRMTGATSLQIFGPYRVGDGVAALNP